VDDTRERREMQIVSPGHQGDQGNFCVVNEAVCVCVCVCVCVNLRCSSRFREPVKSRHGNVFP